MSRAKVFPSISMILILIALSGISVWAAPGGQEPVPMLESTEEPTPEPTISGEVQEVRIDVNEETGETTVLVTLEDEAGETQTVRVSVDTAKDLGLLQVEENGDLKLDDDGNPIPILIDPDDPPTVEIDPNDVIDEDEEGEEGWHPVASALADFFGKLFADTLELEYEDIMGYHESGIGFGVIAQACWMSSMLYDSEAEDNITPGDILEAKKAHDFSSIELADGTTAKNWGQFKKAVLGNEKAQKNLGAIMSGRAAGEQEQEEEEEEEEDVVVGSSTELSGKGKDKGGKPDIPSGKVKDKDKGGGPPAEPPGKVKNKDKGKGGGKKK
jgi:hypothetical protein